MITAWMTYALLVGAIIATAAVSIEWVCKAARLPVRFVWCGGIVLTVLFTVLAPIRARNSGRTITLAGQTTAGSAANAAAIDARSGLTAFTTARAALARTRELLRALSSPVRVASQQAGVGVRANNVIAVAWCASSLIAVCLLLATYVRYARNRAGWPSVMLFDVPVRVSSNVGPATMGIAPPEVVVPQWLLARHDVEQRLVVLHEAEHARAHDPLALLIAFVCVAIMPWNLALWFMWSRLRLAVELDCDHRVLKRGIRTPEYGELLISLSAIPMTLAPGMPAFSFGPSHLERRLLEMTSRAERFGKARLTLASSVALLALAAACNSELPTTDEIASMDVAAVAARVPASGPTEFTVDGHIVTADEAKAIPEPKIASIAVVRGSRSNAASRINIKLKDEATTIVAADTMVLGNKHASVTVAGESRLLKLADVSGSAADSMAIHAIAKPGTTPWKKLELKSNANPALNPLVVVNGVIITRPEELDINADAVSSVEVIKGRAAQALYSDPRALNGVILINVDTRKQKQSF